MWSNNLDLRGCVMKVYNSYQELAAEQNQICNAQQVSNSFDELRHLNDLNCHDPQDMKKLHDAFVEIAGHSANYGFMLAETAAHEAAKSIKRSFGDE